MALLDVDTPNYIAGSSKRTRLKYQENEVGGIKKQETGIQFKRITDEKSDNFSLKYCLNGTVF